MKAIFPTIPLLILALLAQTVVYTPCHADASVPDVSIAATDHTHAGHHSPDMTASEKASSEEPMPCCDAAGISICAAGSCLTGSGGILLITPAGIPAFNPLMVIDTATLWLRPYSGPATTIFRPPIA